MKRRMGKSVERRVVTGFAKITVVGSCEICGLKMSGFVLRPFLLNTMIVGKKRVQLPFPRF